MSISKDPYKGVRDFYPEDMAIQSYIFDVMRKTAESFGYEEYSASVLEPAELYRAKSGEELVNEQTYTFTDRGGREVTLRPEMTPTLARMIARRKKSLVFPLRWYSIPNLFRYERPQRGRIREHWQLNVDIFGVEDISADVEIIQIAYNIMRNFGVEDTNFVIKIGNRGFLDKYLKDLNYNEDQIRRLYKLIDKQNKIKDFDIQAEKILGAPFVMPKDAEKDSLIKECVEKLKKSGIENIEIDYSIVRGLDYYTGIVFEVFDKNPENNRSLFGGGRYDNLLEIFGDDKVPAVGFGMGDVTIHDVLETYSLLPKYSPMTDLYVCVVDKKSLAGTQEFVNRLRNKGLNVLIDTSGKKVGDQIEKASKKNIPYVVCVGSDELSNRKFKIKSLSTGTEKEVREEEIISVIFDQ